jgi:hypothetical protein
MDETEPSNGPAIDELIARNREAFQEAIRLLGYADDPVGRKHGRNVICDILQDVPLKPNRRPEPRLSDLRKLLREIGGDAERLRIQATLLDDTLGQFLGPLVARLPNRMRYIELLRDAGIPSIHPDTEWDASLLGRRLLAVKRLVEACLEGLPPDRGGRTPFARRAAGVARNELVVQAAIVFDEIAPTPITGTREGPFYKFCAELMKLVWGMHDGDDPTGLTRYVAFAAPRARKLRRAREPNLALAQGKTPAPFGIADGLTTSYQVLLREMLAGPDARPHRTRRKTIPQEGA